MKRRATQKKLLISVERVHELDTAALKDVSGGGSYGGYGPKCARSLTTGCANTQSL